ncbi:hypothetical protein [Isoalcanivorax beigongshangi]|uniref:Ead/Ea22-like family protein n=1 Tax=Isoalcanivorax beigongshangi TaxID=3238810 RepID=A0ABV4AHP1_9GAMM
MTDDIKLPELPAGFKKHNLAGHDEAVFTDVQMNEYARSAVLADRERLKAEISELEAERDSYKAEAELNMHRVITCGVAARNPDPELTRRGEYADKWNTDQAESVRKLREERDALMASVVVVALEAVQDVLQDAYQSAYLVCCGQTGTECCGSPDPEWEPWAEQIMEKLGPIQNALSDAARAAGGEK